MTVIWTLYELFLCICEAFIIYYFYSKLLGKNTQNNNIYAFCSILLAGLIFMLTICEIQMGARLGLCFSVIAIYSIILFNGKIVYKALCIPIFFLTLMISEGIALSVVSLFYNIEDWRIILTPDISRIVMTLMAKMIEFILVLAICNLKSQHYEHLPKRYWTLFLTVFIFASFGNYALLHVGLDGNQSKEMILLIFIAFISLTAMEFTIYIIFDRLCLYFSKQTETRMIETQQKIVEQYFEQNRIFDSEIRRIWHDLKNHLLCINDFAGSAGNVDITQYISQIYDEFTDIQKTYDLGNQIVNAVISQKGSAASKQDIHFQVEGVIEGQISMKESELCVLLCNALDNAIEASVKEPDKSKRYVKISLSRNGNNLIIDVNNNIYEEPIVKNKLLATQKLDKQSHGIGMKSMQIIVKKYRGDLYFDFEETDNFNLFISLPIYM